MTNSTMTCEAFDAELPEYLEGTLEGETRARVDHHLRECVRCASLVRDLENIRSEAAALPDLVPSRDLWAGIEARIAAPVIPLTTRPERQRRMSPAWMGIAAAALIVATAGVTYTLTARSLGSRTSSNVAQSASPAASQSLESLPASTVVAEAEPTQQSASNTVDNRGAVSQATRLVPNDRDRSARGTTVTAVSRNLEPQVPHSEALYSKEIAMLQAIVSQRKTRLDSSTVAVIERNLQIIDAAIEQSKAALAKDPASILLSEQLSHALDKKVGLLRTVAMLPAST
ncbi:MAG TPA: zf-HC2 domain-containing protein [Gemmatimonadaceae bacterium]|nr:zf-HC2 domain-containing protein [Gemmatimonadaceae bacterium]